jgi:hypothetical protein
MRSRIAFQDFLRQQRSRLSCGAQQAENSRAKAKDSAYLGITVFQSVKSAEFLAPRRLHAHPNSLAAFGDLDKCGMLLPQHEAELIAQVERARDASLAEIAQAYDPLLESLPALRRELEERIEFADKEPPKSKEEIKKYREEKKINTERLKRLRGVVKELMKIETEAEAKRIIALQEADRETTLARETAALLKHTYEDPLEALQYFALADSDEIAGNEFNLNVPRYVDTFGPEEQIDLFDALTSLHEAESVSSDATAKLQALVQIDEPAILGRG